MNHAYWSIHLPPNMTPRRPKNAERKSPMIATVKAFLSEVCRSIQDNIAPLGGGRSTISWSLSILSPQYLNVKSGGISRTSSKNNSSLSNLSSLMHFFRRASDGSWPEVTIGKSIVCSESTVSKRSRGGRVFLMFFQSCREVQVV